MCNSSKRKVLLIYISRDYLGRTSVPAQRNRRIALPDDDIHWEVDDYADMGQASQHFYGYSVQTDEFLDDNRLPSSFEYFQTPAESEYYRTPAESEYYRTPAESDYDTSSEDEESFSDNESVAAEENIYEFMYSSEYQSTTSNGNVLYKITCTCYASSDCVI